MNQRPQVVVTGLGMTTPLGGNVPDTWKAILAGKSGVHALENDWTEKYGLPVNFAATLLEDPSTVLEKVQIKRMDPSAQYAMIAANEAWKDAGEPQVDEERLAAVVASGIGGVWTILSQWDRIRDGGARRAHPLTVPMLMANAPAANVSIAFGAKAGAHTPVSACASGAEAIGEAVRIIQSGRADVVLAGGTEATIHPMPLASFARMQALSTRSDSPETASRPYCTTRDGFVMGEGSGIVILESADHAAARSARVYARVAGIGVTSDAYDIAPPDPSGQGQRRAMKMALEESGISVADLVHVNAHATATPAGDPIEAKAIRDAFGGAVDHIAVSATKSMTGHLLGGAGAIESIFSILALRDRMAPPTINIQELEPGLGIDVVRDEPRKLPDGDIAALNNAFGFGGHNVGTLFTI